jgi:hypothetical protein
MTFAAVTLAASAADEFGAHRWPTGPKLGINLQPDLCKRILADTVFIFASRAIDIDVPGAISADFAPLKMVPALDGS